MGVSYRLIRPDDLDAGLIEVWRTIQADAPEFCSPYFCPEFTQCVAAVRRDVRIVVIENDGRPAGFFPFQRGFMGIGRPVGGALSDFHGVLIAPGSEWTLSGLMQAANLSVWSFDHLVGESDRFASSVEERAPSAQIDLGEGYEKYVQGRRLKGSDYIPKTEGLARKLERENGTVEFLLHDVSSAAFDQVLEWKRQQYLQSGLTDVMAVSWICALLKRVMVAQGPSFAGICSVLRVNGRMVAGHIGMRSQRTMHYWFPAYDPEYGKFSTGIILFLRMARALAEEGVSKIDMGKGSSLYKDRLMTGSIEVGSGAVELPSAMARLRQLHRNADAISRRREGGVLSLPLRVIRRIERSTRFR